jgi:hypothetical protein
MQATVVGMAHVAIFSLTGFIITAIAINFLVQIKWHDKVFCSRCLR